jgi:pyruvate dehydrogenase E1 component beta subunit
LESWYAHIPGLVVIAPATPADNYALLKAAIRCDDPVVYMEHKNLWGLKGDVPEAGEPGRIGAARIARPGSDLTLVSWSAEVQVAAEAADEAARRGVSVELIDLRCLWPWDRELVFASVARTGRLLVAHEAVQVGGFGGEIAASVAEACHRHLKAPVARLGAPRIPIGYARTLEDEARVTAPRILAKIVQMLE